MKKIIKVLIFILLFPIVNVNAFTAKLTGSNYISENSSFTINLELSNTSDLTAFDAELNYDSSLLELTNTSGLNGWQMVVGTNIAGVNFSGMNGTGNVLSLTFKAKSTFTVGKSTTISINNPEGSNSNVELQTGNNATFTVNVIDNVLSSLSLSNGTLSPAFNPNTTTYTATIDSNSTTISATTSTSSSTITGIGTKTLAYGLNKFEIKVTDKLNNTKVYTINITRTDNRSSDNTLKTLTVSNTSISFNGSSNYYDNVENDVTSVTINATTSNSKATIAGTGTKNLAVGLNTFTITVTAENGTTQTYTIKINRKSQNKSNNKSLSTDNNLSSLSINGKKIDFGKKKNYTYHVDNDVTIANIEYTTSSNLATVTLDGDKNLKVGNNVYFILVYAENGDLNAYSLNIIRDEEKSETPDDNKKDNTNTTIDDNNDKNKIEKDEKEPLNKKAKTLLLVADILIIVLIAYVFIIKFKNKNKK